MDPASAADSWADDTFVFVFMGIKLIYAEMILHRCCFQLLRLKPASRALLYPGELR